MSYFFLFLSFICQASTVVIGKEASVSMSEYSVGEIIQNPYYLASIVFLFLQAVFWQLTLKSIPLNIAYVTMSLVYVVVLISSYFIYNEAISRNNILGSLFIVVGVIIVNWKSKMQRIENQ